MFAHRGYLIDTLDVDIETLFLFMACTNKILHGVGPSDLIEKILFSHRPHYRTLRLANGRVGMSLIIGISDIMN